MVRGFSPVSQHEGGAVVGRVRGLHRARRRVVGPRDRIAGEGVALHVARGAAAFNNLGDVLSIREKEWHNISKSLLSMSYI